MSRFEVVVRKMPDVQLVDLTLPLEQVYTILTSLYFDEVNKPEDNLDVIRYIEDRLVDADLPLTQDDYIAEHSEEYKEYKSIDAVFPIPVGH